MNNKVISHSLLDETDIYLFKSGKHYKLYEKFGSHIIEVNGQKGVYFAVWAPSAYKVEVIGDFNYWNGFEHQLYVRWDESGIWEGFIPDIGWGERYKFKIYSNVNDAVTEKADPFSLRNEHPPKTASEVYSFDYEWKDEDWTSSRWSKNSLEAPLSVYEVHLESWRKKIGENRSLSYMELADDLVNYVKWLGYTHVEFMPIMDYPYSPSWGYQITGYFAASSRFGYPEELMLLIDKFHQADVGVILDWVPAHFPNDAHGLGLFDGSHLYEHPDLKRGFHPHWKSLIFNYGRNEVKSFLISNAFFWFDKYHVDGLRVDAVASMLYLDYGRDDGDWDPNDEGGNINKEAVTFMQELNSAVFGAFKNVFMIAEESTAYGGVTRPVDTNGLGFNLKWMMGWMHDTLDYFSMDPIYRKYHQDNLTFGLIYSFTENFVLPFSHDEVVYGKRSLLNKMPGDTWQKFANLRALYTFMYTHPGSKLMFMGGEFGQYEEWNFATSLDWHIAEYAPHKGIQLLIKELNHLLKTENSLFSANYEPKGFEWVAADDRDRSIISYIRKDKDEKEFCFVILNLTPSPHENYRIGVPTKKKLKLIFNSDAKTYGGSDYKQLKEHKPEKISSHGHDYSIEFILPPLAGLVYKSKFE